MENSPFNIMGEKVYNGFGNNGWKGAKTHCFFLCAGEKDPCIE